MVKELREMTSAGMMECKKALTEADGDMDAAVDVLRTRGLAAAAKRAGRETNEGIVIAHVGGDGKTAVLVEVNCETDFVALNDTFKDYANKIATAVFANDPADIDALKASELDGEKVDDILTDAIHTIGENIQVSRFVRRTTDGAFASYVHGAGKIGILVDFAFNKPETAGTDAFATLGKDIAMQVAASNPGAVSRDSFSQDVIDHEMEIYKAQAADSGKPENIQEKIATGRLEKFYKENALVEQAFVKDPDITVKDYIAKVSKELGDEISVKGFDRYELGGN
jgi:elongation factor Ts